MIDDGSERLDAERVACIPVALPVHRAGREDADHEGRHDREAADVRHPAPARPGEVPIRVEQHEEDGDQADRHHPDREREPGRCIGPDERARMQPQAVVRVAHRKAEQRPADARRQEDAPDHVVRSAGCDQQAGHRERQEHEHRRHGADEVRRGASSAAEGGDRARLPLQADRCKPERERGDEHGPPDASCGSVAHDAIISGERSEKVTMREGAPRTSAMSAW